MRTMWGTVTEISDLGVVAEQCPHCERLMACLLRTVCQGHHFFFMKMSEPAQESSCLCTGCLKPFAGEACWRYASALPIKEAKTLPLPDLLTRTNPVLAERLQFKEQICALGGDARFAIAYQHLEAIRPGALRSALLRQLLDWDRLTEDQRVLLGQQIRERAHAWQFARQLTSNFPESAGCLTLAAAVFIVGPVFALTLALAPAIRGWIWGAATAAMALCAAASVNQIFLARRVRQWTRNVLIPEAKDANVPLDCFVAVVDDIPGSRLALTDSLWPIKYQLETIRSVLIAEGKLSRLS